MSNVLKGFKTVSSDMRAWQDTNYKYVVGKVHSVPSAPRDGKACGPGLHFCIRKADCLQYTSNKTEHIMLEVEAEAEDILGMDNTKTRVSKLKVVKIHEIVTKFSPEFKAAAKELTDMKLASSFLLPKKTATVKKVTDLAKLAAKDKHYFNNVKEIKIIDNLFEIRYLTTDYDGDYESLLSGDFEDFSNHFKPGFKNLPFGKGYIPVSELATEITAAYLQSVSDKTLAVNMKSRKAMVDLLALGCLPLGQKNSTFVVFVPKENHFKTKLTHV